MTQNFQKSQNPKSLKNHLVLILTISTRKVLEVLDQKLTKNAPGLDTSIPRYENRRLEEAL